MKLLHLCLFSFTLILVGCVHYKEYPFPNKNNIKLDSQLIGTWEFDTPKNQDKENGIIGFKLNTKLNHLDFYFDIQEESYSKFPAYLTSIKEFNYINIQVEDNVTKYNYLKYKVTKNQLILWLINENAISKSIKDKTLRGAVSGNMPVLPTTDIYLWEDAERIRKYLLVHNKELFPKPTYFIRTKSTQTPTSSK